MPRLPCTCALLTALVALPTGTVWAEGFTELLAQHDLNGNGLLEPHERAQFATTQAKPELAALPVVCEAETTEVGESASAGGSAVEYQQPPQEGVVPHARLRWEQIAMQFPPADDHDQADAQNEARSATEGYESSAPPSPPARQVVQIRNAVAYRMLLNQQQAQARPQPFAQAATFGPTIGRTKRAHFASAVHDHCGCSRASLYLASY